MDTSYIVRARNNKTNKEPPKYNCEKCKDQLFIFYEENGYTMSKECSCRNKVLANNRMVASGLSEQDLDVGFSDFKTDSNEALYHAMSVAKGYFANFNKIRFARPNSLLLTGLPGRGKTMLGLAVTNNLLRSGIEVKYQSYRDMIMNLKQKITDEHGYKDKMQKMKYCQVLFIDDLFKGKITESDINIMYEIINQRYLASLPTIISTEKLPRELCEIDEALGSRIIEMSKGYIITFDESIPNYRMKGV